MTATSSKAFSPEELRAKYAAERDKRLRPEGNRQYRPIDLICADSDRDPYVAPGYTRAPLTEEMDVLIIGAGLGGLQAGARLRQAGVNHFRMIDKAADFGGTWYWNRYPGAACDIESYIYMPLLEETNYIPTEKYAPAPEIYAHCQRIAKQFDLYPTALFQTVVKDVRWKDEISRWQVKTDRGDVLLPKFVIIAGGVLHKPKLPGVPGIETFKGHSFHTSRWDYAYTGGSPFEPMSKLADKRVGYIGTGATAIQAVPKLAAAAKQLYVFQRTPSGVGPRWNQKTDPEWVKSLRPGWQRERMENFARILTGKPFDIDMVADGWTELYRGNAISVSGTKGQSPEAEQLADYRIMDGIRARVDSIVTDKATAEALKPWYNQMCKRPGFHDEYLPTFNRPNVKLVDTEGRGIDRITETGVVVGGTEYPVDCLIYGSGFETAGSHVSRWGFEIYGRDGVSLTDAWANGPGTLHGLLTRGFPNLIMFSSTQGGYTHNLTHVLGEWATHSAWIIKRCLDKNIAAVEPSEQAQEAWWQEIARHLMNNAQFVAECTPGYYNGEGARDPGMMKYAAFNGGSMEFIDILRRWRKGDDLAGLDIRPAK